MGTPDALRPTVSVIIPAFNVGAYLDACLRSVFCQTYKDYEVIVVDDGSSDNTPQVLSAYKDRRSLKAIRQDNAGTPAARNRGMDAARGEYLCFVDADDVLEPCYIADMLSKARETRADVISSGYTLWEDGRQTGVFPASRWDADLGGRRVSLMCVPTTRLYRADFLRENSIRFTAGERFDVLGFSLMVNLLAGDVVNIPKNNYRYCKRPKSFTARMRGGRISAEELPRKTLADAVARLSPVCDHDVLEFCVVKILAGVLFDNLRRNPGQTVDAFSHFCAGVMDKDFPRAAKNPYIRLLTPRELPFIQRAAMKTFVVACNMRALRAFARAFTRL